MIDIVNKSQCNGCGVCKEICPIKAISLEKDEEGFLYPKIYKDKCIKCGICLKRCPVVNHNEIKKNREMLRAYAAKTTNEQIRKNSSSGGVFTEIATNIINSNGIVFGAAFDEKFHVRHVGIDNIDELNKLMGSKYVQSEIGTAYTKAKEYLDTGRLVLFTGTPCQIGGLYSFLNKEYDNLYVQDIICHGVPSPMVWQKYIEFRETKSKSKTQKVFFRYKKYGWKTFAVQFVFKNCKEYVQKAYEDLYMGSYLRNLCLRPSCHNCSFKTKKRDSDITLADFWGIEKVYPEIDDNKGTSLVIINSTKGCELFDCIKKRLNWHEVDFEQAIKYNTAMTSCVMPSRERDKFIRIIREKGFYAAKRFVKIPIVFRIKKIMKAFILKK
ncbi:MAG: Coenzyme F420 hydrogenase/dehydrogenase, beta subunit C-terminal domain [Clostridia bacterium]|nr:Coenzyme F420 hydrogenase/dehydrogenase, beta subunit C-terminal domain [Clostridia bacterium]